MGITVSSVAEYRAALDVAIADAMQTGIASKAKELIQESMDEHVYSYTPLWGEAERRKDAGGLRSKAYLVADYYPTNKTLIIEATAPWQNRGFFKTTGMGIYDESLADVIEDKGMYHAKARPFMEFAEQQADKELSAKLRHELVKRGL